jgi:hypothetical protein
MTPNKIIFLDIDGVLNCASTTNRIGIHLFVDGKKVDLLKTILDATDAKIVLSSSWRYGAFTTATAEEQLFLVELLRVFREHGLELWHSVTPPSADGCLHRGKEILKWLETNPGVEKWVVIDDVAEDLDGVMDHAVITTWENGLTKALAKRIINMLNEGE